MIVVVGAGGFLGYSLSNYFSSKEINFASVSRSFQWTPILYEQRFISSASDIGDFLCSMPDNLQILYMAGSPNLGLAEQDPLQDLFDHQNELNAFLKDISALQHKCKRFIFASSAGTVYGDSNGITKKETSELFPKSAYGKRNIELEGLVLDWSIRTGIPSSVLRISNPFGPGQFRFRRRGLIQSLIDSSFSGQKILIRGNGNQVRDYIYSTDLSGVILDLLKLEDIPNIVNISSGFSYSARQIIHILNNYSFSPCFEYIDSHEPYDVYDSLVSSDLLRTLLCKSEHELMPFRSNNILNMGHIQQDNL